MLAYNQKHTSKQSSDPFRISEGDLVTKAITTFGLGIDGDYGHAGGLEKSIGLFRQRNLVNKDRKFKDTLWRFGAALFAALTMIGPMLLMVLHKDVATDLATTSVAVVLVAAILAWFAETRPETVVSIVAAYTAVLVVFVGTLQV
jgi:hypothetical protein